MNTPGRRTRRRPEQPDPQSRPGASLDLLVGALGDPPGLPVDLAANHDEYLYPRAEIGGDAAEGGPQSGR